MARRLNMLKLTTEWSALEKYAGLSPSPDVECTGPLRIPLRGLGWSKRKKRRERLRSAIKVA